MTTYAIIERLTPEQRARVAGHRWTVGALACRNEHGACPLGCALAFPQGLVSGWSVADVMVHPIGGEEWKTVNRVANVFIAAVDAGEPGEDRTAWVLDAFGVTP